MGGQVGALARGPDPTGGDRVPPGELPVASASQVSGSVSTTAGGVPRVWRTPATTWAAAYGGTRISTERPGARSESTARKCLVSSRSSAGRTPVERGRHLGRVGSSQSGRHATSLERRENSRRVARCAAGHRGLGSAATGPTRVGHCSESSEDPCESEPLSRALDQRRSSPRHGRADRGRRHRRPGLGRRRGSRTPHRTPRGQRHRPRRDGPPDRGSRRSATATAAAPAARPATEASRDYVVKRLSRAGYRPQVQDVRLPVLPRERPRPSFERTAPTRAPTSRGRATSDHGVLRLRRRHGSGRGRRPRHSPSPARRRHQRLRGRRLRRLPRRQHRARPARHVRRSATRRQRPRPPAPSARSSSTRAQPERTAVAGTLGGPVRPPGRRRSSYAVGPARSTPTAHRSRTS